MLFLGKSLTFLRGGIYRAESCVRAAGSCGWSVAGAGRYVCERAKAGRVVRVPLRAAWRGLPWRGPRRCWGRAALPATCIHSRFLWVRPEQHPATLPTPM